MSENLPAIHPNCPNAAQLNVILAIFVPSRQMATSRAKRRVTYFAPYCVGAVRDDWYNPIRASDAKPPHPLAHGDTSSSWRTGSGGVTNLDPVSRAPQAKTTAARATTRSPPTSSLPGSGFKCYLAIQVELIGSGGASRIDSISMANNAAPTTTPTMAIVDLPNPSVATHVRRALTMQPAGWRLLCVAFLLPSPPSTALECPAKLLACSHD